MSHWKTSLTMLSNILYICLLYQPETTIDYLTELRWLGLHRKQTESIIKLPWHEPCCASTRTWAYCFDIGFRHMFPCSAVHGFWTAILQ